MNLCIAAKHCAPAVLRSHSTMQHDWGSHNGSDKRRRCKKNQRLALSASPNVHRLRHAQTHRHRHTHTHTHRHRHRHTHTHTHRHRHTHTHTHTVCCFCGCFSGVVGADVWPVRNGWRHSHATVCAVLSLHHLITLSHVYSPLSLPQTVPVSYLLLHPLTVVQ